MRILINGWNEVNLTGDEPVSIQTSERITKSGADQVYVLNYYFHASSDDDGGAISFSETNDDSQMLIESSTFDRCYCVEHGGAILMAKMTTSGAGSCVINKCCLNGCAGTSKTTSAGQSIYTRMSNNNKHINKVLDSSVINSETKTNSDTRGTFYLSNSIITIHTVNFSQNACSWYPSALCSPSYDSKTSCFVEFCSVRNNTGSYGISLSETSAYCQDLLKSSNFIGNNIFSNGVIYSQSSATVERCSILENSADPIFFASLRSDNIIVINCTCQSFSIGGDGNIDFSSYTPSPSSFINEIFPTLVNKLCVIDIYQQHFTHDSLLILTQNFRQVFMCGSLVSCLPSHS